MSDTLTEKTNPLSYSDVTPIVKVPEGSGLKKIMEEGKKDRAEKIEFIYPLFLNVIEDQRQFAESRAEADPQNASQMISRVNKVEQSLKEGNPEVVEFLSKMVAIKLEKELSENRGKKGKTREMRRLQPNRTERLNDLRFKAAVAHALAFEMRSDYKSTDSTSTAEQAAFYNDWKMIFARLEPAKDDGNKLAIPDNIVDAQERFKQPIVTPAKAA